MMFPTARPASESFVDYVQRKTHIIEDRLSKLAVDNWAQQAHSRKWRFIAKLVRIEDDRWTKRLIGWRPLLPRGRNVGHPRLRWEDRFVSIAGGAWWDAANDPELWGLLESAINVL